MDTFFYVGNRVGSVRGAGFLVVSRLCHEFATRAGIAVYIGLVSNLRWRVAAPSIDQIVIARHRNGHEAHDDPVVETAVELCELIDRDASSASNAAPPFSCLIAT